MTNWIFPPALVPFFVLVPLTFPDGRPPSRAWRLLAIVAVVLGGVLLIVGAYGMPTLMLDGSKWPNPHYLDLFGSWGATIWSAAQLATLAASPSGDGQPGGALATRQRHCAPSDPVGGARAWRGVRCLRA